MPFTKLEHFSFVCKLFSTLHSSSFGDSHGVNVQHFIIVLQVPEDPFIFKNLFPLCSPDYIIVINLSSISLTLSSVANKSSCFWLLFFFSKISNWFFLHIFYFFPETFHFAFHCESVYSCLLQHFYNRMLKVFVRPFQHLCYLSFNICWLSLLMQIEMWMVVCWQICFSKSVI